MPAQYTVFTNCRLCREGKLVSNERLVINREAGDISQDGDLSDVELVDLQGAIIAPGFLELQTNGMRGFHFTHFSDEQSYAKEIDQVAKYLPQTGVTGFYATIPTVHSDDFKKVGQSAFLYHV